MRATESRLGKRRWASRFGRGMREVRCDRVEEAPPMASVSGDCVAESGREALMRRDEGGERARDNAEALRGAIDCRAGGKPVWRSAWRGVGTCDEVQRASGWRGRA